MINAIIRKSSYLPLILLPTHYRLVVYAIEKPLNNKLLDIIISRRKRSKRVIDNGRHLDRGLLLRFYSTLRAALFRPQNPFPCR